MKRQSLSVAWEGTGVRAAKSLGSLSWNRLALWALAVAMAAGACGWAKLAHAQPEASSNQPDTWTTNAPVYFDRGSAIVGEANASVPGPTFDYAHRWTYDSRLVASGSGSELSGSNGLRSLSGAERLYLTDGGSGKVELNVTGSTKRVFDSSLNPPADYEATLVKSNAGTASEIFTLTEIRTGNIYIFYGLHTAVAAADRGRLKERKNQHYVQLSEGGIAYDYDSSGYISQVTTAEPQSWDVECLLYTTGSEANRIKEIKVYDGPKASATVFKKAEYTYYGNVTSPHDDIGKDGDLEQVKTSRLASDGTTWIEEYTQYRYYRSGSSSEGRPHQVRLVFEPDAIDRITTAGNSAVDTPAEIMTQADDYVVANGKLISEYASSKIIYYVADANTDNAVTTPWGSENLSTKYGGQDDTEYFGTNGYGVVKKITTKDCGGCGGSSAAGITRTYHYMKLNTSSSDPRAVKRIVVEDTEKSDGSEAFRRIYGLNKFGMTLREVFIENPTLSTLKAWCKSAIISDTHFRVTESRSPSAHTLVDTDSEVKNFLDPTTSTNDTDTQNASDGEIQVYEYNSDEYLTGTRVKKGRTGTAYYVSATDWGDGTDDKPKQLVIGSYTYPTQTTTRSSSILTSYTYTFWNSSDTQIKKKTTTLPTISTGQNGSGTATTTEEYYDKLGRLRWTKDGEGYINYVSFHPHTGGQAYTGRDVDPGSMPSGATGNDSKWVSANDDGDGDSTYESTAKPTRSGSLPTALALVMTQEFDDQGRPTLRKDARGLEHWIVYENNRTLEFPYFDRSTKDPVLPIRATVTDDGGNLKESYTIDPDRTANNGADDPNGLISGTNQSHYLAWTRHFYDGVNGQLDHVDRYHDIPSSGDGTLSTNFYRTVHRYDTLGREEYTIEVVSGTATSSSVEQISQNVYDVRDRVTEMKRGVSSTSHDMTSSYNTYPTTIKTVLKTEFDKGAVGDGYVTKTKTYFGTGTNDFTGVNHYLTYRGHSRGVEPFYMSGSTETAIAPYTVHDVDWEGRTTATAQYVSNSEFGTNWANVLTGDGYVTYAGPTDDTTLDRRTLEKTYYDDLGRVYRTEQYEITGSGQNQGDADDKFLTDNFHDRNSQIVATAPQYGAATEDAYDGARRRYQTRTVTELSSTKYSSGAFQYRAPVPKPTLSSMSGGDDKVIEMSHSAFDANGNVTDEHNFEMNHSDTTSIGIDVTANDDYIRSTIYTWYDGADRRTTEGDYGSGDTASGAGEWKYAAVPSRPGTAPTSSSDTTLVTTYSYNVDSGLLETVTDPAGTKTKTTYDDLGRTIKAEEDDTGSEERHILTQYDGLGSRTKLIADVDKSGTVTSGDEVTTYLFEDTIDASRNTNAIYPDSSDTTSGGTDQVKLEYNVDGSVKKRTDQRGTVIEYTYSVRRQLDLDKVTTLGGADNHVQSIKREYDDLARLEKVTSFANSDGTGTVRNQLVLAYDEVGKVITSWQSHEGVATTTGMSQSPKVQYGYDTSSTSGVFDDGYRLSKVTYPNGRIVHYAYDTADSAGDRLHRIYEIKDDSSGSPGNVLVRVRHNGTGRLARVIYDQANVKLQYDIVNKYDALDRFGRVKDQFWDGYNGVSDADRFKYEYDYAGSPKYRDIDSSIYSTNNKDQAYTSDRLHRLKTYNRGTLSSGTITDAAANLNQAWTLDQLGNWPTFKWDNSGGADSWTTQSRSHNPVNEIDTDNDHSNTPGNSISGTGADWVDPKFDAAGNMIEGPTPGNETAKQKYTYDAWNRLVKATDASDVELGTYEYDGLGRRIVKIDKQANPDVTYAYYYNEEWQDLEVRKDADTDPLEHYVWHPYYIDALAVRYYDSDTDGASIATQYFSHDANFNITALLGSTGAVEERYEYKPYGQLTVLDANFGDDADNKSDTANPYTYTGRRYDPETGLYYYRARYYDRELGRFGARDPIGYEGGLNLYEYTSSSPIAAADPSGTDCNSGGGIDLIFGEAREKYRVWTNFYPYNVGYPYQADSYVRVGPFGPGCPGLFDGRCLGTMFCPGGINIFWNSYHLTAHAGTRAKTDITFLDGIKHKGHDLFAQAVVGLFFFCDSEFAAWIAEGAYYWKASIHTWDDFAVLEDRHRYRTRFGCGTIGGETLCFSKNFGISAFASASTFGIKEPKGKVRSRASLGAVAIGDTIFAEGFAEGTVESPSGFRRVVVHEDFVWRCRDHD